MYRLKIIKHFIHSFIHFPPLLPFSPYQNSTLITLTHYSLSLLCSNLHAKWRHVSAFYPEHLSKITRIFSSSFKKFVRESLNKGTYLCSTYNMTSKFFSAPSNVNPYLTLRTIVSQLFKGRWELIDWSKVRLAMRKNKT